MNVINFDALISVNYIIITIADIPIEYIYLSDYHVNTKTIKGLHFKIDC